MRQNKKKYPTNKQAVWLLIMLSFMEIICILITVIILFEFGLNNPELIQNLGPIIGTAVGGYIIWWGWRKTDVSFSSVFLLSKIRIGLFFSVLITVIGIGILISEINNMIRFIYPLPEVIVKVFNIVGSDSSILPRIIGSILFAPFFEELLFRGLILYGFLCNYSFKKALVWSAFLFGLVHLNLWQSPGAFIWGIVFGWWFVKTQSLWPSIVGHVFNNAIAMFLYQYDLPGIISKTDLTKPVVFQPWWLNICGLLLTCLGLWWFHQMTKREGTDRVEVGVESEGHLEGDTGGNA